MKTIKPKPMPQRLERALLRYVEEDAGYLNITSGEAKAILAALEYERRQSSLLLDEVVFGSPPTGRRLKSLLAEYGNSGDYARKVARRAPRKTP